MPKVGKGYTLEDIKHDLITPEDFKTWLTSDWYQHFFYNYASSILRDGKIKKCIKRKKHPWTVVTPSHEAYVLTVMVNTYWKWRVGEDYYFDQTIKSTKYKREDFGEAGKTRYEHQDPTEEELEGKYEEDSHESDDEEDEATSLDAKFLAMKNKANYVKLVRKCRRRSDEPLLPNTFWTPKRGKRKDFKDGWHKSGIAFYEGIKAFIEQQRKDTGLEELAKDELKRYLKERDIIKDSEDPDDEVISERDRQTLEQRKLGTSLPFLLCNNDECKDSKDELGDDDESVESLDDDFLDNSGHDSNGESEDDDDDELAFQSAL